MSTIPRRVMLEIDLSDGHAPVAHPAVGSWLETPTATGWRLETTLDPREFTALTEALRVSPATARERNGLASLALRPVTWPHAVAVTLHFDPTLLAG